jgi:hypothetical protein
MAKPTRLEAAPTTPHPELKDPVRKPQHDT